jgi:hypothetical protein
MMSANVVDLVAGKSAAEIEAMRNTVRYDGIAPTGEAVNGPAKLALTVALTDALEAARKEEGYVAPIRPAPRCWVPRRAAAGWAL